MASDGLLRRVGWGTGIGAAAMMCASYGAVEPPPERCAFPDSAYVRADRNIRVVAAAGVGIAVLVAVVRFARACSPDAEPGAAADRGRM